MEMKIVGGGGRSTIVQGLRNLIRHRRDLNYFINYCQSSALNYSGLMVVVVQGRAGQETRSVRWNCKRVDVDADDYYDC